MWYRNVNYFAGDEGFIHGSICIENGIFTKINRGNRFDGEGIDLEGACMIPGLVDIHVHGAAGEDFSDGSKEGLSRMASYLLRHGITSFMPTSMTLPDPALKKAFQAAAELAEEQSFRDVSKNNERNTARIIGIHMEGPYFSEKKCGAQNPLYLKNPDIDAFTRLQSDCGNMVRIVDLAPELDGAEAFAEQASKMCRVSAGHTDTDYTQAKKFYTAGARHLTHLYNAMPGIHHRSPGLIGAASERDNVTAELIADGYHVHPSAVRMAFKLFPGRICLISDGLRCMGMPDGRYELGGQMVFLKDGAARLEDGTLAGAASDLYMDMKNAILFGIPAVEAIQAATINPARAAGWDDRIGSIEEGKAADCIICDKNLNPKEVICSGVIIR
ncbi:MAG: N-acetylglucosamine-6-phosphate deacetylase [Lachnospiraceae bacterium]|nr:N-acetylglucosamine-6-phosphate deacetylase [Lachnospiraceae bacterium]